MHAQARRFRLRPHRPEHVGVTETVSVAVGVSRHRDRQPLLAQRPCSAQERSHLPPRTRRRLECRCRRVAVADGNHCSRCRPSRCRRRLRHRPGAE
eukprot:5858384-Pleurochrysis_carterae.AAC.1